MFTLFCNDCDYLTPKEFEQTNKKEPHICTKYNKGIRHDGQHPNLPMLKECYKRNIESTSHSQKCPVCYGKTTSEEDKCGYCKGDGIIWVSAEYNNHGG